MLEVSISFGVLGTARQAQVRGDRAPSAAGSHEKRPAGERGVEPAKAQKPRPIEDPAEQDVSHQSLSVMQDVLLRALLGCCICGHASACVPFERRSALVILSSRCSRREAKKYGGESGGLGCKNRRSAKRSAKIKCVPGCPCAPPERVRCVEARVWTRPSFLSGLTSRWFSLQM